MKILILKNKNISVQIDDDIAKLLDFLKRKTPLSYEIETKIVDIQTNNFIPEANIGGMNYYGLANINNINSYCGSDHITIFCYQKDNYLMPDGMITAWTHRDKNLVELPVSKLKDDTNFVIFLEMAHEVMHNLVIFATKVGAPITIDEMDMTIVNGKPIAYYKNGEPEALDGNYAHTLNNLAPYWTKIQSYSYNLVPSGYKYFNPKQDPQMVGVSPILMSILDKSRGISNTSYKINSGKRTVAQNTQVGGNKNSSHLRGLAVDLDCRDGIKRTKILTGLLNCGTPLFIEDAVKHIHVDIDSSIHIMGTMVVSNDD